jgi:hypothetical protein
VSSKIRAAANLAAKIGVEAKRITTDGFKADGFIWGIKEDSFLLGVEKNPQEQKK